MQRYRAVALLPFNKEALIVLGESQYEVTSTYQRAFPEVIHQDLHYSCRGISLQRWRGRPSSGWWTEIGTLKLPYLRRKYNEHKHENI